MARDAVDIVTMNNSATQVNEQHTRQLGHAKSLNQSHFDPFGSLRSRRRASFAAWSLIEPTSSGCAHKLRTSFKPAVSIRVTRFA